MEMESHEYGGLDLDGAECASPPPAGGSQGNPPSKKSAVRKRTKTGCLTCRKRRIKCDEGKPTCGNCIKSKRQCEGYNQRLTFKEPLGSFPNGSIYGPSYYHPHQQAQHALVDAQLSAQAKLAASQGPHAMIAPKPPLADFTGSMPLQFGSPYQGPMNAPPSASPHRHDMSPGSYSSPHSLHSQPPMVSSPLPGAPHTFQQQQHSPLEFRGLGVGPDGFDSAFKRDTESPPQPTYRMSRPQGHRAGPAQIKRERRQDSPVEDGYWQSDDDASMGDSDDEVLPDVHLAHLESNELGMRVTKRMETSLDPHGTAMRSFSTSRVDNILQTYTPSAANSPLNDPQTAAIFWYFVNMTGSSMSLYERHPFDPSPMFLGGHVPKARRHIWTYVFPIIAFSHPALMQAMLALGSLQMANCQGLPPTAAMKHYHLCLRRVAKNYASPQKRTQPATLAATLLLGFYEVWNSDHEKWCRHMWGARAIIRELPLRRMTREILALKKARRRRQVELESQHHCDGSCYSLHADAAVDADLDEIDTDLIFQLTGQNVGYSESGHVEDDDRPRSERKYTENDIETYETLSDLYWWFCKMDVYQSILGGTRPFMEYPHWTQCAPRARFGRIDAVYGTFDHLMLLMGRLVSFASRDMARKRKARQAEAMAAARNNRGGGAPPGSMPPPGGSGGPPPGGPPGGPPGAPPMGPMFPGLLPSTGKFQLPKGFSPPPTSPGPATAYDSDDSDDVDGPAYNLDESTAAAAREWDALRTAFEVFRNRLGPDFAPLDDADSEPTPFGGPALTYRTFSIAGIWMNFYMGLIVLYRCLPSMPPVAMAAAGLQAAQTAPWAREIARIAAGLGEDLNNQAAVSMSVGAACIEAGFCLFVAGVQFREADQRHWLVRRLHHISRLTGWQSARQIADGCESAWIKAALLGRGPPYATPPDLGPLCPDSIWTQPRRIDRRIQDLGGQEDRLVLARTEQAHYALGLLGVEQDLDKLDLVTE